LLFSGFLSVIDPGYGDGELLIREWDNDSEQSVPAYRFNDNLPDSNDPWWTTKHNVELKVSQGTEGNSNLAVYIDDQLMFDDFSFQPQEGETFIGLRVWGTETQFEEMEIDSL
jgi:hypothetical protein